MRSANIQSTADRQTSWTLSKPMRADLARDGIDFSDLKRRPMTVYVDPARRTHAYAQRLAAARDRDRAARALHAGRPPDALHAR